MPKQTVRILKTLLLGLWLLPQTGTVLADSRKKEEAEFVEFLHSLPGDYDNLAQTQDEKDAQHTAVVLSIKPLNLQALGRLVLLARETAANDKRRVLAQRIWTLERDKEHHIVQRVYLFKEPQRWSQSIDNPEVLQALLPDDLQQLFGCELLWTRTDSGFSGSIRPNACRPAAEHEGMLVETSAELKGDDLLLSEQQAGTGRLSAQTDPASSYRFQRRGG
ncbi:MAG TPA: CpcT/CpeT family chromophore lyase [Steroidobacteraceae bacterium]|jgi:CpeT/CpcT family protein DUF1001|nr:CpcT/CpeT family chromophore lyase [Steroidobacteraceae bacterium]